MNDWVSPRDLEAPGVRLFCLPHAGAGAASYYRWKRLLAPEIAVCPVMLPGREVRLSEPLLESVGALVDGLEVAARHALDRPYAIFGHSMGALLAFEWARRIERAGLRAPACVIVSGRNAPGWGSSGPSSHALHELEDAALLTELEARYGARQAEVLADAEMRAVLLPILRADLKVAGNYHFAAGPLLRCPVRVVAGTGDRSVSDAGLAAWCALTTEACTVSRLRGGHFYTLDAGDGTHPLLQFLRRLLPAT